jgi:uncharacterized protein YcbK (DUF882 family)
VLRLGSLALLATVFSMGSAVSVPEGNRALKIYHVHTGEKQVIVFKRNGVYDKDGLRQLNWILRDWRKNRPTNMDPHEMDLLWQVYAATGSDEYIHIVCGYRSPATNSMLRSRSRGVAKHSQHMLGKAVDFFIPGVPLAKLREIGLRMQVGGVGYYPTSGSPFVHMDTGSVRMWPRMSRAQLARVFPNGKTLYLPADGGPLPGYAEALAAYKARKGAPAMMVASRDNDDEDEDNNNTVVLKPKASGGITVAAYDGPLPSPRPARAAVAAVNEMSGEATGQFAPPDRVAAFFETAFADSDDLVQSDERAALERKLAELQADGVSEPAPAPLPRKQVVAMKAPAQPAAVDFNAAADDVAPAVPAQLASAMAERDQAGRLPTASLPIQPTAVVATVDVTRPLRAAAMTTAVLRKTNDADDSIPQVLAYAPAMDGVPEKPHVARMTAGIPLPQASPARHPVAAAVADPAPPAAPAVSVHDVYQRLPAAALTMTKLDTQGLRLWSASASTREKRYALLTMPDFGQTPSLLDKPTVTYAEGFGASPYGSMRTDSFAGALVEPPSVVDLSTNQIVAAQ